MIILHRPYPYLLCGDARSSTDNHNIRFIRRPAALEQNDERLSTQKCLASAKHIVRLVRLQKEAHGLRFTAPAFQHAVFCAGTILALSAVEDLVAETAKQDAERRQLAMVDLSYVISGLREIGETWTTALTSASVLEGKNSLSDLFQKLITSLLPAIKHQWGAHHNPATDVDPTLWQPTVDDTFSSSMFPFMFPSW